MGLKSFLDNIIPNELKGNAGKILGLATAGYLGYKYAPNIYSSAKNFIGTTGNDAFLGKGGKGNIVKPSGMLGFIDKYSDTKAGKFVKGFGKQIAGKAMEGESDSDARARYEAERARMEAAIRSRNYGMPSISQSPSVGNFSVSQARVPGFNNSRVNESLNLMSYFMQDLNDNGRIDSSALHAEGSRGTTIRTASAKNLQIGLS
jgi:hypothetical protein